jgi:mannose-6-phosphate isomerase
VRKPWGSRNLLPWSGADHDGEPVGEIWFQRARNAAPDSALLLKLLFAEENLSIQVHPDDLFARSIGLPNGKTEAWYVLSATPGAKVAVGPKQRLTTPRLRAAIEDGSIAGLLRWQKVRKGDVVLVPAGTIHAIGAGVVLAEIQQSSDATFRIFDYGRGRELHVDNAMAVANAAPADVQDAPRRLSDSRTLLIACQYFVLERIVLAANAGCDLNITDETWLLVLEGDARIGRTNCSVGDAFYLAADEATVQAGAAGLIGLLAYAAAEPRPDLLARYSEKKSMEARS